MLSNAYFVAKFRFDTAENEPAKNLQNFRKMHFSKMHSETIPQTAQAGGLLLHQGRGILPVLERDVPRPRAHARLELRDAPHLFPVPCQVRGELRDGDAPVLCF